ncbi:hypothetical protein RV03_GL002056 [Enterococcus gallinarum]|nr:hypothetical protein RV03_GL002056 [Enterococcus gallinarum]
MKNTVAFIKQSLKKFSLFFKKHKKEWGSGEGSSIVEAIPPISENFFVFSCSGLSG